LGNQDRPFEQPAKILLAGVLVFAVREPEIGGGLVSDGQSFEVDNADVFFTAFPDLALLKFHE
jgi:hypothetical protein